MGLKKYLLISTLLFAQHNYSLERIQSESVDKGKVSKVYVAPGLATLMKLPCVIKEAIVGNNSLVKACGEREGLSVIDRKPIGSREDSDELDCEMHQSGKPICF
jgi:hypothetical protein